MPKTTTVALDEPLVGHNGPITRLVIKEPTVDQYIEHGDPWTVAMSEGGVPFMVENPEVIRAYVRICLVEPADPLILNQGGVKVGRALKEAVLGFFRHGVAESAGSPTSPTTSPSTPTPAPAISPPSAG